MNIKNILISIILALVCFADLNAMQTHAKSGIPLSQNQRELNSKLRMAIYNANPSEVKRLLNAGADPNAFDNQATEDTLLLLAVMRHRLYFNDPEDAVVIPKSIQVIHELVKAGGNPNFKNEFNESALDYAINNHYSPEIITLLSRREKG